MPTVFENRCNKAADDNDVIVEFIFDKGKKNAFYDDGSLHVVSGRGLRAVFDLDENAPAWTNGKIKSILPEIGYEKFIEWSLVEESDDDSDDDECCPHCGCDCGNYQ
jgi:hypothetical protein